MLGLGNQPAGTAGTSPEQPKPQAKNAWIGAAVGIGGLIYDAYRDRKNTKDAKKQFNEQMDNSVSRRVEDAKQAGVHPLFALGASVGASPTIQATQNSQTGANLGRIVQDTVNRGEDRDIKSAQIRALNAAASADEALAIQRLSGDSVDRQGLAAQGRDVLNGDGVEIIPDLQIAANPKQQGHTAGTHPLMTTMITDDGLKWSVPDEKLAEILESPAGAVITGMSNVDNLQLLLAKKYYDDNQSKIKSLRQFKKMFSQWWKRYGEAQKNRYYP